MILTTRKRVGAVALLAMLFLDGCNTACVSVGCVNGLQVKIFDLPAGAVKVELLVDGASQLSPYETTCTNDGCYDGVAFNTRASDHVSIRVTSTAGVRVTEFGHLEYVSDSNDGCGGKCQAATVEAFVR